MVSVSLCTHKEGHDGFMLHNNGPDTVVSALVTSLSSHHCCPSFLPPTTKGIWFSVSSHPCVQAGGRLAKRRLFFVTEMKMHKHFCIIHLRSPPSERARNALGEKGLIRSQLLILWRIYICHSFWPCLIQQKKGSCTRALEGKQYHWALLYL